MDIDTIFKRLKENENLARKFHEIEVSILTILNYEDLFKKLLDQIQLKFSVPLVWLSISKESEVSRLAQQLSNHETWRERINLINWNDLVAITGNRMTPRLINTNMDRYARILPRLSVPHIRSVALAPISLDGKLIGSLNQGDYSASRFHPGLDTYLLQQLAIKVSLCLSNVTAHEKLRFMAFRDPLTGLLNRRALDKAIAREFSRALRYDRPLSVVFIDLNRFKQINDTHGHEAGDEVLTHMARILMEEKRETDIVARFAGDEFVVVLSDTSYDEADHFMRRILLLVDSPVRIENALIRIRFSYGIASTQTDTYHNATDLIRAADVHLYAAKHGTNQPVSDRSR